MTCTMRAIPVILALGSALSAQTPRELLERKLGGACQALGLDPGVNAFGFTMSKSVAALVGQ